MKQSQFESRHQSDWHVFAQQLQALERGKSKPQHVDEFAGRYRHLC